MRFHERHKFLLLARKVPSLGREVVVAAWLASAASLVARDARRGEALATTDCLIAGIAVAHQATIVTGNLKDYAMPEVTTLPLLRTRSAGDQP